jgi:hypothetical protein
MTLIQQAYGMSPLRGFHKVHEGGPLETFRDHPGTGSGD